MLMNFLVGFIFIWLLIFMLHRILNLKSYGVEVKPYLLVIWRTRRFNNFIWFTACKLSKVWRIFFSIGLAVGLGLLFYSFKLLGQNLLAFIYRVEEAQPIVPIIPGLTISPEFLIHIMIALPIVLIVHEFSHGVSSCSEGIPLKSAGLALFIFLPLGFIEPEEERVKEAGKVAKLRLYSSGSIANLFTALALLTILLNPGVFNLILSPLYEGPSGILVLKVIEGSPAWEAGLKGGDVIIALNGTAVMDLVGFKDYMAYRVKPKDRVNVTLLSGAWAIIYVGHHPQNPAKPYIGIRLFTYYPLKPWTKIFTFNFLVEAPWHLYIMLSWTYIISISAALINMLPITPFDGDKFLEAMVRASKLLEKSFTLFRRNLTLNKIIISFFRTFALALLILNITLSVIFFQLPL